MDLLEFSELPGGECGREARRERGRNLDFRGSFGSCLLYTSDAADE